MASKGLQGFSGGLRTLRVLNISTKDPLTQCLAPRFSRSMATETSLHKTFSQDLHPKSIERAANPVPNLKESSVLTTIYKFPTMEPLRFESYNPRHLYLPLRRDILHRAVIFEGDSTRQGTASSKTRYEVHGGHRKIRPQKGTGHARLGTRQSPMLRGGGKSFGPHPRDFATGLPRKMYDLAWRTALSWRYRRGELIICEDGMDIEYPEAGYVQQIFEHNHWGQADGRSLVITATRKNGENLFEALADAGQHGKVQILEEVDVKNLLELGRVIIEKSALDVMLVEHSSDLRTKVKSVT